MLNQIVVGPVLGFRGLKAGRWFTSALVVLHDTDSAPQLNLSINGVSEAEENVVLLKSYANYYVWRLDWSVKQTDQEQAIDYTINNGPTFRYIVPAHNKPLRICYGSCFGVHTLKDINKMNKKNALWKVLLKVHLDKPYHLFFLGGDQVYSDQVWENVLPLREWLGKSLKKRVQAPFTPDMQQQAEQFYFNLYLQMWSQKRPAAILSQIPTLMMWDDHDIFDGWGSYVPKLQECAVFQGIFKQAREHFHVFQLQAKDHTDLGEATPLGKEGYTYAHRLGDIALVALDLRSERTIKQVLSPETRYSLQVWLEEELKEKLLPDHTKQPGCKHLFVMSGIPIVNADLTLLETALDLRPGQQRMEDDLKDQWLSHAHQKERLQLIQWLFRISREFGCRITIVSGDAHLAFMGYLQLNSNADLPNDANVIHQFTSSAMVNLPPPALIIYMMEKLLAGKSENVSSEITAHLQNFPDTNRHLIGARNWLSLSLDEQSGVLAEWYVEGEKKTYATKIKAISTLSGSEN